MSDVPNLVLGRIADMLKYPCRNAALGCLVTTLLTEKNDHERSCPFRHFKCLFSTCQWTGFKNAILPHLRSTHSPLLLEGRRHQIDVELTATPTNTDWAIYCFDRIFRFNVFQLFRESNIYASAYLVGGSGRAIGNTESDFTYTVTVKGPSDAQTSNTWQTQDDETVIANHIPERCFSIPSDRLQYFVRYGDVLRFHVELNLRVV